MRKITEKDIFDYLEELRESGQTNMFGATPYIEREFNMETKEARAWLVKWMESYK